LSSAKTGTAPEALTIEDLLKLSAEELDRRKSVFEVAKLAREEREKKNEGWLQKLAPHLTPIAAFTGIVLSLGTILSFVWTNYSSKKEAEQKYFSDLVQSASQDKNGTAQRIAGILLLRQYWGREDYEIVLANSLTAMLAREDDESILDACAEAIGHCYNEKTPRGTLELTRTRLYGNLKGDIGALMKNESILIARHGGDKADDKKANDTYDLRIRYIGEAVRLNWLNLERVNLFKAELPNIRLYEANLKDAILREANFSGEKTQLFGSDFERADLRKAKMEYVDARGADFNSARIQDANLDRADFGPYQDGKSMWHYSSFASADLRGAFARGAIFDRAILQGADLRSAHLRPFQGGEEYLRHSSFVDANLLDADLRNADFTSANLTRSNLTKADLSWAVLDWADLTDANLVNSNLKEALLEGATLTGTNLEGANLEGATFSSPEALKKAVGVWNGQPRFESP